MLKCRLASTSGSLDICVGIAGRIHVCRSGRTIIRGGSLRNDADFVLFFGVDNQTSRGVFWGAGNGMGRSREPSRARKSIDPSSAPPVPKQRKKKKVVQPPKGLPRDTSNSIPNSSISSCQRASQGLMTCRIRTWNLIEALGSPILGASTLSSHSGSFELLVLEEQVFAVGYSVISV